MVGLELLQLTALDRVKVEVGADQIRAAIQTGDFSVKRVIGCVVRSIIIINKINDPVVAVVHHVGVITEAAVHRVLAGSTIQQIAAIAADEVVVAALAEEGVIACHADKEVVAEVALKAVRIAAAENIEVRGAHEAGVLDIPKIFLQINIEAFAGEGV